MSEGFVVERVGLSVRSPGSNLVAILGMVLYHFIVYDTIRCDKSLDESGFPKRFALQ